MHEHLTLEQYLQLTPIERTEYITRLRNIPAHEHSEMDISIMINYLNELNEVNETLPEGFQIDLEEVLQPNQQNIREELHEPIREYQRTGSMGLVQFRDYSTLAQQKEHLFKIRNVPTEIRDRRDNILFDTYWNRTLENEFIDGGHQQDYVPAPLNATQVFNFLNPILGIGWNIRMEEFGDQEFIYKDFLNLELSVD